MAGLAFVPDAVRAESQPHAPLGPRLRSSVVALYGTLAVVATSLFISWPINVWQYVYAWPGFNFIRVPARFVVLTLLALAVLAASGFERLTLRCTPRAYFGWPAVLAALLLGEYATPGFTGVPFTLDVPAIDRWLATQPKPFVFVEVPVPRDLGSLERQQTRAMLHSTVHWQRTVHGYSGIRPGLHDQLNQILHRFPDEPGLARLRELGVRYVVVHTEQYAPGAWPAVDARLRTFPQLRLVHLEGTSLRNRAVTAILLETIRGRRKPRSRFRAGRCERRETACLAAGKSPGSDAISRHFGHGRRGRHPLALPRPHHDR